MKKQHNYYWDIVSPARAKEVYKEGGSKIYKLFSDDTEALIESEHDLHDAIDLGIELGIQRAIL